MMCNRARVVLNDLLFKGVPAPKRQARVLFRKRRCQSIVTVIVPAKPVDRTGNLRGRMRLKGLLHLALDGNAVAYAPFLEVFSGYLRGMLRRRLRSYEDDIEDVLQEVLIALHNGLHTYRNQVPVTAWAAAIVRPRWPTSCVLKHTARRCMIPLTTKWSCLQRPKLSHSMRGVTLTGCRSVARAPTRSYRIRQTARNVGVRNGEVDGAFGVGHLAAFIVVSRRCHA